MQLSLSNQELDRRSNPETETGKAVMRERHSEICAEIPRMGQTPQPRQTHHALWKRFRMTSGPNTYTKGGHKVIGMA